MSNHDQYNHVTIIFLSKKNKKRKEKKKRKALLSHEFSPLSKNLQNRWATQIEIFFLSQAFFSVLPTSHFPLLKVNNSITEYITLLRPPSLSIAQFSKAEQSTYACVCEW